MPRGGRMFEFVIEVAAMLFGRLLRAELPDCTKIFNELRAGERKTPASAKRYVLLCHMTGVATLIRGAAIACLMVTAFVLIRHVSFHPFPFDFDGGGHDHEAFVGGGWGTPPVLQITQSPEAQAA